MDRLKKFIVPTIIAGVLIANFSFGFPRLSRYSSVDEPYWTYARISKFWNAIAAHKWKSTNINDKPGITVVLLSGFGLTKINPMQYKSLRQEPKTAGQLNDINYINFIFRLPIFLFDLAMLLVFYFLLKKLFNRTIALFSLIFIGLSPILLGISLIINPDALLWTFLPLSMIGYFVFQKENNRKYLILSGIFLGLALLTKYVSNILYVFFFTLPFFDYIFREEKPGLSRFLRKSGMDYLILVITSMITFFILFPATWKKPSMVLKGTFLSKVFQTTWPIFAAIIVLIAIDIYLLESKNARLILDKISRYKKIILRVVFGLFLLAIAIAMINTYAGMKIYNFESIIASPKGSSGLFDPYVFSGKILADFFGLIFGVSPLILLFAVYAMLIPFRKKIKADTAMAVVFYFLLFIALYYIGSTVNSVVATVRYQIALYPLFLIVAAIGLEKIVSDFKLKKIMPEITFSVLLMAILIFSLFQIKPFYFAYASSILPSNYTLNLKDMGDGSYEAADYLNSLPNAQNMTIWSDKGAVCAEFRGNCVIGFKTAYFQGNKFSYFVTSTGRKSRTSKLYHHLKNIIDFPKAYSTNQFAKEILIGNQINNVIKIVPGNIVYKQ